VKSRGAKNDLVAASLADEEEADGRRQRSSRSRERIVLAMIDLIRAGEMSPAAARVAEKANVGLRTVFRHFEEMETDRKSVV
jgi:AcrR family transcriptional regulator